MASSLSRKCGCDMASRSTQAHDRAGHEGARGCSPARTAPPGPRTRPAAPPRARTRISAVVSCSRSTSWSADASGPRAWQRRRWRRPGRRRSTSSTSRLPVRVSEAENSSESSTMAAKSATDAAATTVWPRRGVDLARVLEHRHDEAERGGGQRDGDEQRDCSPSRPRRGRPDRDAEHERHGVPEQREPQHLPASCCTSISSPARNSRNARPSSATIETGRSTSTQPST